jgi:transcriptional regulator with XRE-family HTH domain
MIRDDVDGVRRDFDMYERKRSRRLTPLAKHIMARGLNQKDVAGLMRVQPSTVCSWVSGKCRPEAERIPVLANHLKTDADHLTDIIDQTMQAAEVAGAT